MKLRLSTKLIVTYLGCGLIPLATVALVGYVTANKGMDDMTAEANTGLKSAAGNQLTGLRDVKRAQVESYFKARERDLNVLTENVRALMHESFNKLTAVQVPKRMEVEEYFVGLRKDILTLAQSHDLRSAFDGLRDYHEEMHTGATEPYDVSTDAYNALWEKYDKSLGAYVRMKGYQDVLLICGPHGHVMYSSARGRDMGTNLSHGPYKDEGLAHLWHDACGAKDFTVEDFSAYAPSDGEQAGFVGAPLFDEAHEMIGLVAFRIPVADLNRIVQRREGLGTSGETYLVGLDHGKTAFRSDMLTMGDGKYVVGAEIHTAYIDRILESGQSFQETYVDSAGNPVLVVAEPVDVKDLHWACITKMSLEEQIAAKLPGEQDDLLTKYTKLNGYYDLFLINSQGYCFYSVGHEADYHTNFASGQYKDSNLGRLVQQVSQSGKFGFADFEPYAPSNGDPAAFIAEPVVNDGQTDVIVALELSLADINAMMAIRDGMGETGETILVGPDYLMRSDSFRDSASHSVKASFANPDKGKVYTKATRAVHEQGQKGLLEGMTDYVGNKTMIAYAPVEVFDRKWCLNAKVDEAEALAAVVHAEQTAHTAGATLVTLMLVCAGVVATLVTILSLYVTRSINKPISGAIRQLSEGALEVTEASTQVASASQQLAESASEQASSLQETSAALEEVSAMTRSNAEHAKQANTLSGQARAAAEEGDQTMHRLNDAMGGINESSSRISKIIKVIEEIAFQTNLLALNAAVEAARAGEHGKGFAVVAEEVRNLAQRAAGAARETTSLIEESVERAQEGVTVAHDVGEALSRIVADVAQVTELVNGIAQASNEQAEGVSQVNTAVSQMDKLTQSAAAGAEQSAAAAEELSAQANTVNSVVDGLARLVGGGGVSAHTTPALTKYAPARTKAAAPATSPKRPPASPAPMPPSGGCADDTLANF
ncbi:MAG: methyl-accepting chemotaxis protein [Phycisphaerae bacterium]|jgi:methyl-accepting chemotaxis protein